MTPEQLATFRQMIGYGSNNALPSQFGQTGSGLLSGGASGALGALNSLGGFNPNMGDIASGAKQYASGLDIPGAVNNAMLVGRQQARDVINPGIEADAAGTGNINSSRTGIAQGLVDRGLAEQGAGLASSMYNDAYGTGAGLASANNAQRLQAMTSQGALGSNLATGGYGIGSGSINDQGNLFNLAGQGGAGLQGAQQDNLTNLMQRYQSQVSSPYDAINQYFGLVGNQIYGQSSTGTSNSTTTSTPSALQTIGGLMSAGGNLAAGFSKSDINAKEDIVQVGTLFDGQKVYRFRYKGHPAYHLGLMAQDVEQINPDAVTEFDGYKYVHYHEATKHIV